MERHIHKIDPHSIFARLTIAPGKPVVAAVSGGSDSMALLVLLDAFFRSGAIGGGIVAATVDHGLRPESASEAERVAAFCASRGIPHRTLHWLGPKPVTGVAAAARDARHGLLSEAAVSLNATMVLTGHTANDQAETIAMRRERGDGRGLSGIAPATLHDGVVWFVRPLLSQSRAALRALLLGEGVSWIDDPSNEHLAYERARVRKALAGADEDQMKEILAQQGRLATLERVETGRLAARLIGDLARLPMPGLVRLEASLLSNQDDEAACLSFRLLLSAIGGREHLPDAASARKLMTRLASKPGRGSLAGVVVDRRRDAVFLHREIRAGWTGAAAAVPGTLWDGRFRIAARELPANTMVEFTGKSLAAAKAREFEDMAAPPSLVRAALAAEPIATFRQDEKSGFPGNSTIVEDMFRRVPSPYARYLPSFDLAPARALWRLLDGDDFPASPWDSHNAA